MGWKDFDLDSGLERDVLRRALPLAAMESDGTQRVTIDMASRHGNAAIHFTETLGPTPGGCVDLLELRPLLTGATWKVLDLLLEAALDEVGESPDLRRGWSIKAKVAHARARTGRPAALTGTVWAALMDSYVATEPIRHSLVHRRVYTDSGNSLIGVDDNGAPLRPFTWQEQEALARSALRASSIVILGRTDPRAEADLSFHLTALAGLHGHALANVAGIDVVPEITVILDRAPDASATYDFDIPDMRRIQPFKAAPFADLIVTFRDRPGQDLRGRLEDAPEEAVRIDPDAPPDWLN